MSLIYRLFIVSLLVWPGSLLVRADSALFYLVASANGPANLLSMKPTGGAGATFTGPTPVGKYYFDSEGSLRLHQPIPSDPIPEGHLTTFPMGSGCTAYGIVSFVAGSSTDPCQRAGMFQSVQTPQFGSKLLLQGVSGFYACGDGLDIWWVPKPGYGPPGQICTPFDLYIVPVMPT